MTSVLYIVECLFVISENSPTFGGFKTGNEGTHGEGSYDRLPLPVVSSAHF